MLLLAFEKSSSQDKNDDSFPSNKEKDSYTLKIANILKTSEQLEAKEAIYLVTQAAEEYKFKLSPFDTSLSNLYHKAGVLYYSNDSFENAISWFNKSLVIRERHSKTSLQALLNTLNGLTQSHLLLLNYDLAENLIERQLALLENANETYSETKADLYLADAQLAFVIEDYSRSLEKLNLASKYYELLNQTIFNNGVVQNMLGINRDLLDQPKIAIEHYKLAIKIFEHNKENYYKAMSFHNLGMAYSKLMHLDSAKTNFDKAYQIHKTNNDSLEIARYYIEISKIEAQKNQFQHAKELAELSLMYRKKLLPEWHSDVIESQLVLGKMLSKEANLNKSYKKELELGALKYFETAINSALKSPRKEIAIEPISSKAMLLASQGANELGKAKIANTLFLEIDSMVQVSRIQFRQQESKIEFTRKIRNTYEAAINNALLLYNKTQNEKYFDDAINFCEKSKATAIRDKFHKQTVQVFAGIPDSLLNKERLLNFQLSAATEALLSISAVENEKYTASLKTLETVKHNMEEFDEKLEKDFPKYYNWLREPERNVSVDKIQQHLKPNSLLVEYFLSETQIVIFGVAQNDYRAFTFNLNDSTTSEIKNFIENIENSETSFSSAMLANAHKVYQLLLQKPIDYFAKQHEIKNLKIVPDGIIASVPFDALMTQSNSNISEEIPYLIKKYSHNLLYSNKLLLEEAPPKQLFGELQSATFGIDYTQQSSNFGESQYQSLPFIKEEVLSVNELNGGSVYLNENATIEQLEKELNQSEMLHLAVHGAFNEDSPKNSGLVFSKTNKSDTRNNILTLPAIYGLNTSASFIYLSACFSGKGVVSASEGVMSLARAFTYAGAKSQVITLWEVSDKASAIIAKKFYENLKKGDDKDEALRQAKISYINESSSSIGQRPFFWAGSVLVGNSEPIYYPSYYWWIAVFLIVIACIWFVKKFILEKSISRPIKFLKRKNLSFSGRSPKPH
jgi:CHAT domain-containing protein/tetratricopeptide (TPR) repeat protein